MIVSFVLEKEHVVQYLHKRNLIKQYKGAKQKIMSGVGFGSDLKKLKPTEDNIRSFRINKKYRAHAVLDENKKILVVFDIYDHQ